MNWCLFIKTWAPLGGTLFVPHPPWPWPLTRMMSSVISESRGHWITQQFSTTLSLVKQLCWEWFKTDPQSWGVTSSSLSLTLTIDGNLNWMSLIACETWTFVFICSNSGKAANLPCCFWFPTFLTSPIITELGFYELPDLCTSLWNTPPQREWGTMTEREHLCVRTQPLKQWSMFLAHLNHYTVLQYYSTVFLATAAASAAWPRALQCWFCTSVQTEASEKLLDALQWRDLLQCHQQFDICSRMSH